MAGGMEGELLMGHLVRHHVGLVEEIAYKELRTLLAGQGHDQLNHCENHHHSDGTADAIGMLPVILNHDETTGNVKSQHPSLAFLHGSRRR